MRVSTRHRKLLALLALLGCLLVAALPAAAGALTVDQVSEQLRCPTCNTQLNVSNAPVAVQMKAVIADKIAAGWTQQRIINYMVGQFGQDILATPPKSGFDLIAWVVPPAIVLAGLGAILVVARASRGIARAETPDVGPLSPDEEERIRRATDQA